MGSIDVGSYLYQQIERRQQPDIGRLAAMPVVRRVEALAEAAGVTLVHGMGHPAYWPEEDVIRVPNLASYALIRLYKRRTRYAIDLAHELAHAVGHEKRLGRPQSFDRGSAAYAREELVAESSAVLIGHDLGVSKRPPAPHNRYISAWLNGLPNARIELDFAMSRANQVVGWLLAIARHRWA